jgi:hypothetical protein
VTVVLEINNAPDRAAALRQHPPADAARIVRSTTSKSARCARASAWSSATATSPAPHLRLAAADGGWYDIELLGPAIEAEYDASCALIARHELWSQNRSLVASRWSLVFAA